MMTIISIPKRIAYKIKRIIFKNNRLGRKKNPFPSDQELFAALRHKEVRESFLSAFQDKNDNIFFINPAYRKKITNLVKENFTELMDFKMLLFTYQFFKYISHLIKLSFLDNQWR